MMILADLTAEYEHDSENGYYQLREKKDEYFVGYQVAEKYQDAKNEFCHSGSDTLWVADKLRFGGMEHGHMMGTYYFLANDYKNKLEVK